MKKYLTLVAIVLLFPACSIQNNIKKVELTETGYRVNIAYDPIIDEISKDGIKLKITPISPDELNNLFIQENTFNGKFDYSNFESSREEYFLVRKKVKKQSKSDQEFLVEGLNWLIDNSKISKDEYTGLLGQIKKYFNIEEEDPVTSFDRYIFANPYYIGDKYLNVYRVEISNTTDSHKVFDQNITVEIGDQVLYPMDEAKIVQLLKLGSLYNTYKQQSLERNHLPKLVSIPPNSRFVKFFATLPINNNEEKLYVSSSDIETKAAWNIKKEEDLINDLYTYYELDLSYIESNNPTSKSMLEIYDNAVGRSVDYSTNFNVLRTVNNSVILDGDQIFIDQDFLSEEIEIFTISLSAEQLYYGSNMNKGENLIDIKKNKRKPFGLELQKIKELKRRTRKKLF